MNTVLLSTAYLAPVEYYVKLLTYDRILVEQYDHYAKQTYRNRCTIAAPDGPLALSVPTVKPDTLKCFTRDMFLMDFNEALCRLVCSLIDFTPHVERTTDYIASPADADDFRERIHPKKDFRAEDPAFHARPYYQVFQDRLGFLPNLSIVDLLFNMGPESVLVLRACQATEKDPQICPPIQTSALC